MINLAGRMDTSLRAAQLAHRWMVKTAERNDLRPIRSTR